MKLLRNRSLKQLSILIAWALFLIVLLEIVWLRMHFNSIEAVQNQIDFARTVQLHHQKISLTLEQASKNSALMPRVVALVGEQDNNLVIIKNGGRVPGTTIFLKKLQRLPAISFTNLIELWENQKVTVSSLSKSPENIVQAQAQAITLATWYNRLIKDLYDEADKAKNNFSIILIVTMVANVLILATGVFLFFRFIVAPLRTMELNTKAHNHSHGLANNEIGKLAFQINAVIEQLRDATDFVKGIGEGKLDMDYKAELDSEYTPGENKLADELIEMQNKLRSLNTEEQRRQWTNEGITRFVDILRNASDNLNELGDKIIATLVQYTQSNQGGLYILNDDDDRNRYLELIALYAFNLKKFEKQHIKLGEGILGQTFLEKETTYLTNLPEDHVRITSGLGDSPPKSILLVPLKVDRDVYGIVELASYKEFLPHEISFVEKLGETIASTLSSVKVNQKNRKLLEQFQVQAEQMRAQEEEMRQNMEELTATQEGMQRLIKEAQDKEAYLNNLMDATADAIVAIDRDYKVVMRNDAELFKKFLAQGIPYEKGYYVLGLFKKEEFEYHKSIYDRAFAGETVSVTKEYFGRQYAITYNPLRSSAGEIIGISVFAHDETEVEALKAELTKKEKHYLDTIEKLEATRPKQGDEHWAIAEELEKTFRIQLEALKITQQEAASKLS
jgi:putative methionine-R-sulfoxide reductase with GAF domain